MAQEKGATRLLDKRFLSIAIRAIDRQSVQDKSNQAKAVLTSTRLHSQAQAPVQPQLQPQLQPQPLPPPLPLLRSLPVELLSSDASAGSQSWSGSAAGAVGSVVVGAKATRPPIVNKKFLSNTIRDVDCHNAHSISERERAIENAEKREREREKSHEQSRGGGGDSATTKRMRREDERERKHWQRRKEQAIQAQQNGTSNEFKMTDESQPVSDPEDGFIDLSSYDDSASKVKGESRVDNDDDDDDQDSNDSSGSSSGSSDSGRRKQIKKRKREDKAARREKKREKMKEKKERKKEKKERKKADKERKKGDKERKKKAKNKKEE